jgi:hypothetical protein
MEFTCKRLFEFSERESSTITPFSDVLSRIIIQKFTEIEEAHLLLLKPSKKKHKKSDHSNRVSSFSSYTDAATDWISSVVSMTDRLYDSILCHSLDNDIEMRKAMNTSMK